MSHGAVPAGAPGATVGADEDEGAAWVFTLLLHAVDRAGNEQKGWTASTLTVK